MSETAVLFYISHPPCTRRLADSRRSFLSPAAAPASPPANPQRRPAFGPGCLIAGALASSWLAGKCVGEQGHLSERSELCPCSPPLAFFASLEEPPRIHRAESKQACASAFCQVDPTLLILLRNQQLHRQPIRESTVFTASSDSTQNST